MRAIITGSNAGLGFHTASALAMANVEVVLAVRSLARGNAAKTRILATHPLARVEVARLDLSSLQSVRNFVADQGLRHWNLLINNAGAKIERPYKETEEGFEWHTGVNHLGHFALAAGLWPSRAENAKVVTVSSVVAGRATLESSSIAKLTFNESRAYEDSKLLNLLFATNLARLISEAGLTSASIAAHPGFSRAQPYGTRLTRLAEIFLAQPATAGAQSILRATAGRNGDYFAPRVLQLWGKPTLISKPPAALSLDLMQSHWVEAERATGIKFEV